ncbi:MAG: hypothetical protein WC953_06110 [Pseudomonas sp.]
MEALLILGGVVVLVLGWLWLVASAMRRSVGRMLLALFFGPFTLLLRGLGYPLGPRLLMLLGLAGIVGGGIGLHYQHPDRLQHLLAGSWLMEPAARSDLRGTIMGQPFNPNRIVWRGDDLVFEEGIDDRVRRSLTIRFGSARELLLAPSIERLPADEGVWPELILRWHTGALSDPGLRRVTGDYSLSMDFTPVAGSQVEGRIHLHLPTIHSTWLTGRVHLASAPEWMQERDQTQRLVLQARQTDEETGVDNQTAKAEAAPWRELSLLAVVDEPELFTGAAVRLTTWTGRVHEGTFKQLSPEKRLVLSLPKGPNQIELHFHPLDVRLIEEATRRR